MNKGTTDQLVRGGIMKQTFATASELLDDMTKIKRAWYTPDVFPLRQEDHPKRNWSRIKNEMKIWPK